MFTSAKLLFLSGKIEPTTVRVTNNIRIFKVYSAVTGVTSLLTAIDMVRLVYYDLGGGRGVSQGDLGHLTFCIKIYQND